ncbi:GIY-YIG nuclease family protein [Streptomyces prasinus]|uniref:GIY-YIG nuclease family protein n=1 Tax=Streptomyces prasinus TaxID=67345 RepID=UPI0033B842C5
MTTTAERTALYRFFDTEGALLYVGITKSFGQRWLNHSRKKPWWPQVQSHTAEWFKSRPEAEAAEKQAVVAERPLRNVVHKPRPQRAPVPRSTPAPQAQADENADYWTVADIAAHWRVATQTVRAYRSRKRGELPDPDHVYGRTPLWRPATIIGFERPGQGARTDLHDKQTHPTPKESS